MRKWWFVLLSVIFICCFSGKLIGAPVVNGRGAILIDLQSGQVLWGKNEKEAYAPASITKILTAIMAIESNKLEEVVTIGEQPPLLEGTRVYLEEGEQVTLLDLVKVTMIHSANDAALAIAEHLAGSEAKFAELMNQKAQELGALNTNFVNAHGLSAEGHYTTAYDQAVITRYALQNPLFREIVQTKVLPWQGKAWQTNLINKNELLWSYEGAMGVKTGYTSEAKSTIVAAAERNGQSFLAVVLGSVGKEMWTDAQGLLDYGFQNFQTMQLVEPEEIVATLDFTPRKKLEVIAEKGCLFSLPQGGNQKVESQLVLLPLGKSVAQGEIVGKMIYQVNGETVGTVNLLAKESVRAWNFKQIGISAFAALYLVQILWRFTRQWRFKRSRRWFASSRPRRYQQHL